MSHQFEFTNEIVLVSTVDVIPFIVMEVEEMNTVLLVQMIVRHLNVSVFTVWVEKPLSVIKCLVEPCPHPVVLLGNVIPTCPHVVPWQNWNERGKFSIGFVSFKTCMYSWNESTCSIHSNGNLCW